MNRKDIVDAVSKKHKYGITEIFCVDNEVRIMSKLTIPKEVVLLIENICKTVIYRNNKGIMSVLLFYHNDIHITSSIWREKNSPNLELRFSNSTLIWNNETLLNIIEKGISEQNITMEEVYPTMVSDNYIENGISCLTCTIG